MLESSSSLGFESQSAHKNAKSHQHHKAKQKVKPTQKPAQSAPLAPVSSFASVSRVPESVKLSKVVPGPNSTRPKQLLPKSLPSYTSHPLPPLVSHDIAISEDEHDPDGLHVIDDSLPPPTCAVQCCSYSYSLLWESGCAVRFMIRRTRARNSERESKQNKYVDGHDSANDAKVSLNVRVPFLVFLLVFVLIACWSFVDVAHAHKDLAEMLHGSGAKSSPGLKHTPGKTPPSMRQFYHFPDGKNGSLLIASDDADADADATGESPVGDFIPIIAAKEEYLSTPYLVVASTPTGAPGPGLHVPCTWVEERYGSAEKFADLTRTIDLVRKGIDPATKPSPPPPPATATDAVVNISAIPFVHTERFDAVNLLDSVGIYCQTEEVRSRCELDGGMSKHDSAQTADLTSVEISRLHRWFLALPEDGRFEDAVRTSESGETPPFVVFNQFTGAIATLNCRNKIRYSAPFAKEEPPSVYIEPNNNSLPPAFADFVANRCSKEAKEAAIKAEAKARHAARHPAKKPHAAINKTSTTPEPPAKKPRWIDPLIPLLPPICSASSFSRPSLARACLRNSRIISFGDSTLQELMITLVDFLEQDDGEDPNDLTRMLVDNSAAGRTRSPDQATEWMPPNSGSDGQPRYLIMEHWATPESCKLEAITHLTRIFNTARFPTPYLTAYNITITHQWNLDEDICANYRGPNWASSVGLHRMAYRRLTESCLADNAHEIVEKYRRKPDGTLRNAVEYFEHVNSLFHYLVKDRQIVYKDDPPPFGCKYPYLTPDEYNQLTLPEWQLHMPTVPNFDYAILNMGAHQTRAWDMPDNQRGEAGYSYSPEQFHHAMEAHVTLVQSVARHVVIRETGWRSDPHFGKSVPAMNVIMREVAIEAEVRALQKDMELAQLREAARQKGVDLPITYVRRSVSWLPTFYHTLLMPKEDPVHCSYKLIWGGNGVGNSGIRTPYCYGLLSKIIQLFCSKK